MMVGVGGLEPPTSASRTQRSTNWATPRMFKYSNSKLQNPKEGQWRQILNDTTVNYNFSYVYQRLPDYSMGNVLIHAK